MSFKKNDSQDPDIPDRFAMGYSAIEVVTHTNSYHYYSFCRKWDSWREEKPRQLVTDPAGS